MADRLVIGIGNPDRGDDAVGRLALRRLRARDPAGVRLLELDGEATAVLAAMQGAGRVWLIDAAQSGAPPGAIHRIDPAMDDALLPHCTVSSHGFGVAQAIRLARAMGTLPRHCIVYAIEAADFTVGALPSAEVMAAVDDVVRRIAAELAQDGG